MDKRSLLKECAYKLFADYGYNGTSISDIAKAAGIQKSNVYFYYPKKEELLVTLLKEEIEGYFKYMVNEIDISDTKHAKHTLFLIFKHNLKYFFSNEYKARFVIHFLFIPYKSIKNKAFADFGNLGLYNPLNNFVYKLFKLCSSEDLIEYPPEDAANFYYWFCTTCILNYIKDDIYNFHEDELEKLWRFFWKGIKK